MLLFVSRFIKNLWNIFPLNRKKVATQPVITFEEMCRKACIIIEYNTVYCISNLSYVRVDFQILDFMITFLYNYFSRFVDRFFGHKKINKSGPWKTLGKNSTFIIFLIRNHSIENLFFSSLRIFWMTLKIIWHRFREIKAKRLKILGA